MGGDESAVLERLSSLAESSSVQLGWLEEMELPAERPSSSASSVQPAAVVRKRSSVQEEWSSCVWLVLVMGGELAFSGVGGASVYEPSQMLYVVFSVLSVSSSFYDSSSYGTLLY